MGYGRKYDDYNVKFYTNVDWVGNGDDRKRTSSEAFFLGERMITWRSKKHNWISQSIVKVEYVVGVINCSNILWIEILWEGMKEEVVLSCYYLMW